MRTWAAYNKRTLQSDGSLVKQEIEAGRYRSRFRNGRRSFPTIKSVKFDRITF